MMSTSDAPTQEWWMRRIRRDTEFLRTTDHPVYRRIRELLVARGVDPHAVLVANIMREDTCVESGFLVTDDRRVYEFELDWRGRTCETGVLSVWRDLTETYQARAFHEPIAVALAMLPVEDHSSMVAAPPRPR